MSNAIDNTELAVAGLDWGTIAQQLDSRGFARTGRLLDAARCQQLRALYQRSELFRSRIVMARHGFGSGEYQYFDHPLPDVVLALRRAFYQRLAPIANIWNERLGLPDRYPSSLAAMLKRCHQAGQTRPTPLLLKYQVGDYNRLHQDLYGELAFPIQVVVLLSEPGADFSGGEFVLTEQKPRSQSRANVVPVQQGHAVVFAVNDRPVQGSRGWFRVKMRHGVSELTAGDRMTMGLIFHDAT